MDHPNGDMTCLYYETANDAYDAGFTAGYHWLNNHKSAGTNERPTEPKGPMKKGVCKDHRDSARRQASLWEEGFRDGAAEYDSVHPARETPMGLSRITRDKQGEWGVR